MRISKRQLVNVLFSIKEYPELDKLKRDLLEKPILPIAVECSELNKEISNALLSTIIEPGQLTT